MPKDTPQPKTITLTQLPTFEVEVDGKKLAGTFRVVSEWEGFVKLECDGPCETIIIEQPYVPLPNRFDMIPKIFGGNRETNIQLSIECKAIRGPR